MSSKRHSILPAIDRSGPKPPVNFSSTLIISDNAILQGTHSITMQAETVIHPRCRFESNEGSVLIGRRCIVHERAHIGARPENPETAGTGGVAVGDYVQIEVGSIIESGGTEIGEGSLIQVGSKIGSGTKIGAVRYFVCSPLRHACEANGDQELYDIPNVRCSRRQHITRLYCRLLERHATNGPTRRIRSKKTRHG